MEIQFGFDGIDFVKDRYTIIIDREKKYKVYPNKKRLKFQHVSQNLYEKLIHYKIMKKHISLTRK